MKIEQIKERNENDLMELPNVVGVGIGEKNGKPAIKVFVTHKVELSSLKPKEIIPKRLGQYDVDVEEIGIVMAGT
ncbi:MAG: hypothetical protein SF097_03735 [Acidobacteriota bacterium]|nr:hypothetical protein [Acidobacteriota bacterium]